jgi:hypothetical protein
MANPSSLNAVGDIFQQFVRDGIARFQRCVDSNESEGQYLDFKESKDKQGKVTGQLTDDGRSILGKLISAYAYTEGGVIVWGIESKNNSANSLSPIASPSFFVQDLESASAASAAPGAVGVQSIAYSCPRSRRGIRRDIRSQGLHRPPVRCKRRGHQLLDAAW